MKNETVIEIIGYIIGFSSVVLLICLGYYLRGDTLREVYESCDEIAFHFTSSEVDSYNFDNNICIMKNGEQWIWINGHPNQIIQVKEKNKRD